MGYRSQVVLAIGEALIPQFMVTMAKCPQARALCFGDGEPQRDFQGEKGSKEHKAARNAIHNSYGTSKFASSVKKYLKKYGIPDDWSTLMLLLDYKDDEVLVQVIETLKEIAPERSPVERQGFKDKLEILAITASSSPIISLAEKLSREL